MDRFGTLKAISGRDGMVRTNGIHLRGDWIRQNGCFFGKLPKGGGGSFPIQKITLQILLVSKQYILEKKSAM